MTHSSILRARRAPRGFRVHGLQALVACGLSVSLLAGCGGGDDKKANGAGPGTSEVVERVAMDGFLLLRSSAGLMLLDPETGKTSQALPLAAGSSEDLSFGVSPNGRQVAFQSANYELVIANVTFEGGAPGFEIVHELSDNDYRAPRYTPDGLRILTANVAVDPATGDAWPCVGADELGPLPPSLMLAIPGGHRYICTETAQLKEDGDVLAEDASVGAATADGQFSNVGIHVASGTTRAIDGAAFDDAFNLSGRLPLADGTFASLYGSARGEAVAESPGGFVTIYNRIPIDLEQRDGVVFDIGAPFESGDWSEARVGEWPMRDAGFPLLSEGDGSSSGAVGISGDGRFMLAYSSAWNIVPDRYTNVLYQVETESAFSLLERGGGVKSFRSVETTGEVLLRSATGRSLEGLALYQPELLQDSGVVDFGDGNLLTRATPSGPSGGGWAGYYAGKPYFAKDVGRMSRDGRWFFGRGPALSAEDQRVCLTQVGTTAKRCLSTSVGGEPIGIVGYGLKSAHAKDAPEILALSRTAAWPGSSVTVFGARFGEAGTLRVGDASVAESQISEWADDHIVFTMSEDLPASGRVAVETAQGEGGRARQFWLHRTRLVETPFDGIATGVIPLGQGLNVLDLGDFEAQDAALPEENSTRISSRARLETGEYVVYSPGAEVATTTALELTSGDFKHKLLFRVENRLVDDGHWQPVQGAGLIELDQRYPSFRRIAGDLVEYSNGTHPLVGERVTFRSFENRIPGTLAAAWGAPDFWRDGEDGGSAYVLNKDSNTTKAFFKVVGWDGQAVWGTPEVAPAPKASLIQFLEGVEGAGQTLVLTGSDLLGTGKAGFQLSTDGGSSFGPMTLVDAELGNASSRLLEPIRVEAAAGTFFLVMETLGLASVVGMHGIGTDGSFSVAVAEVPPGAQLPAGLAPAKAPLEHANVGGKLLLHFPLTHTLVATDFDAAGDTPKTWATLPSAADAGKVLSLWQDQEEQRIYVVKDDGSVAFAPAATFDDPAAWQDLDLRIELALPTLTRPVALSRLEDGRWLVLATLNDPSAPGEHSPFGASAFLVSPKQ